MYLCKNFFVFFYVAHILYLLNFVHIYRAHPYYQLKIHRNIRNYLNSIFMQLQNIVFTYCTLIRKIKNLHDSNHDVSYDLGILLGFYKYDSYILLGKNIK